MLGILQMIAQRIKKESKKLRPFRPLSSGIKSKQTRMPLILILWAHRF